MLLAQGFKNKPSGMQRILKVKTGLLVNSNGTQIFCGKGRPAGDFCLCPFQKFTSSSIMLFGFLIFPSSSMRKSLICSSSSNVVALTQMGLYSLDLCIAGQLGFMSMQKKITNSK